MLQQRIYLSMHLIRFNGDFRPIQIKKVVKGFKPSKNDFLFEVSLTYKLPSIICEFSNGKPTLVFCQTQKGTMNAAKYLLESKSMMRQAVLTIQMDERATIHTRKRVAQNL
jgi:replicative superfamily II helicase